MSSGLPTTVRKVLKTTKKVASTDKGAREIKDFTVLAEKLVQLYEDGRTSDLVFIVGEGEQKKEFRVNKDIISIWSRQFKELVYSARVKKEGFVELKDKDPVIFEQFLKYLYSGKIDITKENVAPVLDLAHEFNITPLVDACMTYLSEDLDPDNVIDLLLVARKSGNKSLEEKYMEYIYGSASEVVHSQDWVKLPEELLVQFLQADHLAASEADIFESILRWCRFDPTSKVFLLDRDIARRRNECKDEKEGKLSDPKEEEKVKASEEKRSTGGKPSPSKECGLRLDRLQPLLKHVRWGRMSLKDFMKVVRPTGLVPEERLQQFIEFLANPDKADKAEFNAKPREPPAVHRPATANFHDNTGILYYIGTDEGKSTVYRNPLASRTVLVSMSSSAGAAPQSVADRNISSSPAENSYGRERNPWIAIDFKESKVRLESYFIAQEHDHYLRNWRLEGSDDGNNWDTLREHVNDTTLTSSHRHHFFLVNAKKYYSRFRIYVTGPSHTGQTNFDITQLEFYGFLAMAPKKRK